MYIRRVITLFDTQALPVLVAGCVTVYIYTLSLVAFLPSCLLSDAPRLLLPYIYPERTLGLLTAVMMVAMAMLDGYVLVSCFALFRYIYIYI